MQLIRLTLSVYNIWHDYVMVNKTLNYVFVKTEGLSIFELLMKIKQCALTCVLKSNWDRCSVVKPSLFCRKLINLKDTNP